MIRIVPPATANMELCPVIRRLFLTAATFICRSIIHNNFRLLAH